MWIPDRRFERGQEISSTQNGRPKQKSRPQRVISDFWPTITMAGHHSVDRITSIDRSITSICSGIASNHILCLPDELIYNNTPPNDKVLPIITITTTTITITTVAAHLFSSSASGLLSYCTSLFTSSQYLIFSGSKC